MKPLLFALAAATLLCTAACGKADEAPVADAAPDAGVADQAAPATQAGTETQPASPDDDSAAPEDGVAADDEAVREREQRQAKLDYATMEDGYLNDPNGQWAASATASTSFGSANDEAPDSHASNTPWQATGAPNGDDWTNNNQTVGFDWIELKYAAAVTPTQVRVVLSGSEAIESITKVELIDTTGKPHVAWSGLSDAGRDDRGPRSWFVKPVEGADYTTDTVKLTFANNVASGYKTVDAVQLVGQ